MSLLDTDIFEMWMKRVMERLDRNEKILEALNSKEGKPAKLLDGERLLDNQDLCQLLQTSKRSLQRYRSSGALTYHMLWHKVYYKESDVQLFLTNHAKEYRSDNKRIKQQSLSS
ncbi:MAG: helix-turn-helix domain-containing protein [Paludibacter sp.]